MSLILGSTVYSYLCAGLVFDLIRQFIVNLFHHTLQILFFYWEIFFTTMLFWVNHVSNCQNKTRGRYGNQFVGIGRWHLCASGVFGTCTFTRHYVIAPIERVGYNFMIRVIKLEVYFTFFYWIWIPYYVIL